MPVGGQLPVLDSDGKNVLLNRAEIEGRNGQSMTKQLLVLVKKHILPLKLNLAPFFQELEFTELS